VLCGWRWLERIRCISASISLLSPVSAIHRSCIMSSDSVLRDTMRICGGFTCPRGRAGVRQITVYSCTRVVQDGAGLQQLSPAVTNLLSILSSLIRRPRQRHDDVRSLYAHAASGGAVWRVFRVWWERAFTDRQTFTNIKVWRYYMALYRKPITELRSVTCRIGSRSVTCHPTQVNTPRLNPN